MKKIVVALVAACLLFSCIDSDDDCSNGLVPISLTSKVVVSERSSQQDIQIVGGQEVGFFVTKAGNESDILYDNTRFAADGNGFFTGGEPMYYPIEPVNVDLYAIHPYQELAALGTYIPFTVQENQTILKNYYDSDLLFSRLIDIEKTRQPVPMVFNHMLTKLTFVVKQGPGIDLSGLTNLDILTVYSSTEFYINTGSIGPTIGISEAINVYGVKGTVGGETEVSGMAAIIVPQNIDVAWANPLFKLTINGNEYFYTPTATINFEGGKVYSYILTVSSTGIEVTSSINDWLPGGDIEEEIT